MRLRKFCLQDYEAVTDMLVLFFEEVYSDRKLGYKYSFYKTVDSWIKEDRDIVVIEQDNKLVGFSEAFIDRCNGMTEPVYNCEYLYVREEYRNSKAAYMLYNNINDYSKEIELKPSIVCRAEVKDMVNKHFNAVDKFIIMQGV